ncbi:MAG: hypothetical protein ACRDOY_00070 [Nocardioidaceae bacterium]
MITRKQNKNEGLLDQDRRLESLYAQHLEARQLFLDQAKKVRDEAPRLGDVLELRAREHHTVAMSLRRFFLTYRPLPLSTEVYAFEKRTAAGLPYFEADLAELRPHQLFNSAVQRRTAASGLAQSTALFAVALFLLTLAELARSGVRHYFAVGGTGVVAFGLVYFVLVLTP